MKKVKKLIRKMVLDSRRKIPTRELEKAIAGTAGVQTKTVRLAIRDLVELGDFTYTHLYGTSFLERSFDRPVRISQRIVLKPPEKAYQPQPGEVVMDLASGAAFGNGAHPTTCLALRAIDVVLDEHRCPRGRSHLTGLDVGTGTGVLALALALLGVQKVVGTDIDPCALSEATHNVSLNGLGSQVMITKTPLEQLAGCFSVIVANLAYPTLTRLSRLLSKKMEKDGALILSGFKAPASEALSAACAEQGLRLIREETDHQWACLILRKSGNMVRG